MPVGHNSDQKNKVLYLTRCAQGCTTAIAKPEPIKHQSRRPTVSSVRRLCAGLDEDERRTSRSRGVKKLQGKYHLERRIKDRS